MYLATTISTDDNCLDGGELFNSLEEALAAIESWIDDETGVSISCVETQSVVWQHLPASIAGVV